MFRRNSRSRLGWWTGLGTLALAGVVSGGVLASYAAVTLRFRVDQTEHVFNVEPDAEGRAVVQLPLGNGESCTLMISKEDIGPNQEFSTEIYTDPNKVPTEDGGRTIGESHSPK